MSQDSIQSHQDSSEPKTADKSGETDKTNVREGPLVILKGFFMGAADVVPGVSGGTMALILGVYTRLIYAIKSVNLKAVKSLFTFRIKNALNEIHWLFLLFLGIGMACAVVFFTRIVPLHELMYTHPERVYGLFFGLIAGSVFLLAYSLNAWSWKSVFSIIAGTAIGFRIVTLVPAETPETAAFVFFSGTIAVSAMVLPGISGSFILLILQQYDHILGNISLLGTGETWSALTVLVPFGLGMITGIVIFARLLSWLLKNYYVITLSLLIGFMMGSLYVIWPFQEREFTESVQTRVVSVDDETVQELKQGEEVGSFREYKELGDIVNPQAPENEQKIELKKISRHTIASNPFLPRFDEADQDDRLSDGRRSLISGYLFILGGFGLVAILGYLSRWKIV